MLGYNKSMNYRELGYQYYDDYLAGPEWKEIHDFFYKFCGPYECRICRKPRQLLLHKRSYQFLTMKALRKKYIFKQLIIRVLKKLMCWLCKFHNGEIHFYDNGQRVPLEYAYLLRREREIDRRYHSLWRRFLKLRPSDFFELLFR